MTRLLLLAVLLARLVPSTGLAGPRDNPGQFRFPMNPIPPDYQLAVKLLQQQAPAKNQVYSIRSLQRVLAVLAESASGQTQTELASLLSASTLRNETPSAAVLSRYLGIKIGPSEQDDCLRVTEILGNSPADLAGLLPGDCLFHINARIVKDLQDLPGALENVQGEKIVFGGYSPSRKLSFLREIPLKPIWNGLPLAVWISPEVKVNLSLLQQMQRKHAAEIYSLDFAREPKEAASQIQEWMVKSYRAAGEAATPQVHPFPTETRMLVTSLDLFREGWEMPFDPRFTKPGTFGTEQTPCEYMHLLTTALPVSQDPNLLAVELPLEGGRYGVVLVLPAPEVSLSRLLEGLTPQMLHTLTGTLAQRKAEVNLMLPRFSFSSSHSLRPVLELLGVKTAFNPLQANFSTLSPSEKVSLSEIVQQVDVTCNEVGFSVVGNTQAQIVALQDVPTLRFDRPFLFLVVDHREKSIVSCGTVTSPAAPRQD